MNPHIIIIKIDMVINYYYYYNTKFQLMYLPCSYLLFERDINIMKHMHVNVIHL
jgi:hypothetical protein